MRAVYKFGLSRGIFNEFILPEKIDVRLVGMQDNYLYMWAEYDPYAAKLVSRKFVVRGTGEQVTPYLAYCGSTISSTNMVWHVYEVR